MLERKSLQASTHKPIRSFVERRGRISPEHWEIFNQVWPLYGLPLAADKLDLEQIFERAAPITLEIGFGDGRSLLAMAQANPQQDFIGIEVYKAGIVKLLVGIHALKLSNIRIYCADALEVLHNCIPDHSLQQVQLFFPDPWPKNRHHKRRIVQPEFVQLIATKLQQAGIFHMATDWQEYAEYMLAVMESQGNWSNVAGKNSYAERPDSRPMTKFEQRGNRLGYGIWDLIFSKSNHD